MDILVVDDERTMRTGLSRLLAGEGYAVRTANDGEDALRKIAERRPDLVLLDVMMPKMNGFRCCEEIRKSDEVLPIVFLTAKDAEADQVRGLGLGGDDYVSKAAGEALLIASVKRAIARVRALTGTSDVRNGPVIRLGDVTVNEGSLSVCDKGVEIAQLTKSELEILSFLNAHRGDYFVIDDLITEMRGNGCVSGSSLIYSHVNNLRRKLGRAGDLLVTTRGVGYCLLK